MIIKNMCMDTGGRLAAIDSREKEDYFKHILCKVIFFFCFTFPTLILKLCILHELFPFKAGIF